MLSGNTSGARGRSTGQDQSPAVNTASSQVTTSSQVVVGTDDGRLVSSVDNVRPQSPTQSVEGESRQSPALLLHPDDSLPRVTDITPMSMFELPSTKPDFPTLNHVPKELRPGFWMGREFVRMWVIATELRQAQCKLVGAQAGEVKENPHVIYKELMELRSDYLNHINRYPDEREWLINPPGNQEGIPDAEVNYRKMHIELLDILATCPARLYKSCLFHDDEVATGKPEPQSGYTVDRAVFFQHKSPDKSLTNAVNILYFLCLNLSLRPADPSNAELIQSSLEWLGGIAAASEENDKPLSVTTSSFIKKSQFMKCVIDCDRMVMFSDDWSKGNIEYYLSRIRYFYYVEGMSNDNYMNDLGVYLCRFINITEEDYKKAGKDIVEVLICITEKIINNIDECPKCSSGIQNLLSLQYHDLLIADSDCPHIEKLFQKLGELKAKHCEKFEFYHSCIEITFSSAHLYNPLYCLERAEESINPPPKVKKSQEEDCLPLQAVSNLKEWSGLLKSTDRRKATVSLRKKNESAKKQIEVISRISKQFIKDFAGMVDLEGDQLKEKFSPYIGQVRKIIDKYQVFMRENPEHGYLIADQGCLHSRETGNSSVHDILSCHKNVHDMIIQYCRYLEVYRNEKISKLKDDIKSFTGGVEKLSQELDEITNVADSFIEEWVNRRIISLCHLYVCERKLNLDVSVDIWAVVNNQCIKGLDWYTTVFVNILTQLEPGKKQANYLHRCINWQRVVTSFLRGMRCGPIRKSYEIISARAKNSKVSMPSDIYQKLQIFQIFFDEKLSELEWVRGLKDLSLSPHVLGDMHNCIFTLMAYLTFVYKKHVEIIQCPLVTHNDWKESEEILKGISDFVMQGSFSCHWAGYIRDKKIAESDFLSLLEVIFKAQLMPVVPPEDTQPEQPHQPEPPQESFSVEEELLAVDEDEPRKKKGVKKGREKAGKKGPAFTEPTAAWRIDDTEDEIEDASEEIISEQSYDENVELLQAKKLISYCPMEAIAKLTILQSRYEGIDDNLSCQIKYDLAEASIQLLSRPLERARYATRHLKKIQEAQEKALKQKITFIDKNLYVSLLKHCQEATDICGQVSEMVSIYQPHIDRALEMSLNPHSPSDDQDAVLLVRERCREVSKLVASFKDYMQVVADCIANREKSLRRMQQSHWLIAATTEAQQESRSINTKILNDAEASVKMAQERVRALRDID